MSELTPLCAAPGCVEPAEGFVGLAYVTEFRRYLCERHLRPVRLVVADILNPGPRRRSAEPPGPSPEGKTAH